MLARADLYPLPGFHDPVSSMTHLVGGLVFLWLGWRLLRRNRGDGERTFYLGVYAFANVFLMSMSAVYHMMEFGGAARAVMERLDHGAIFVLIAGTFTPVHGILFRGWDKWGFLLAIWALAVTGITLKTTFFTYIPPWLGLAFYLSMGWLGAVSTYLLWKRFGLRFIAPLVWGGLCYSIGAIMEYRGWLVVIPKVVDAHELFHLMVLAGAGFHWSFVRRIADGKIGPRRIDTVEYP